MPVACIFVLRSLMWTWETQSCTGNFASLKRGQTQSNAQWVNSFSFGDSGKTSEVVDKTYPKYTWYV